MARCLPDGAWQDEHDISMLRSHTPGTSTCIHFQNAGSALPIEAVVEAQKRWLDLEATIGGYETVDAHGDQLERPYRALATMLHCKPHNIAITGSATSAWTQVFFGLPFTARDRILTSVIEYGSNYIAYLQVAKRTGVMVEVIPEDEQGEIDTAALEVLVTQGRKPALIAITHIPTNSGRVYDAAAVGAVARRHGVPYLLDACQSAGQLPLDVAKIGCDWLSGTARKYLRGPRGVGFLYASDSAMERFEPAVLDVHSASWGAGETYTMQPGARRYEQYERNVAGVVGFGIAVEYALSLGMDWIWGRVRHLAALLRERLNRLPGVTLHDRGRVLCGIVSFNKVGVTASAVVSHLLSRHINVKCSAITSTRIDFERSGLPEVVVRASVHYYNTEEEVEKVVLAEGEAE